MAAGYVYVLVNSSMPGLVKVGKTSRPPSERVQELSRATGVATPFVVAFEQQFGDCGAAEQAVHAELERRGLRPAPNREFFVADASQVVRVILNVAASSADDGSDVDSSGVEARLQDADAGPWDDLILQADALLAGEGNEFQDTQEAIRLYKMAARLGSSVACRSLGMLYFYGHDVEEDQDKALGWLKEGAKRGDIDCYLFMARSYCKQCMRENAMKACRRFFEARGRWIRHHPEFFDRYDYEVEQYVHLCLDNNLPIQFPRETEKARTAILSRVVPRLEDEISTAERQELTRVRDILCATMRH